MIIFQSIKLEHWGGGGGADRSVGIASNSTNRGLGIETHTRPWLWGRVSSNQHYPKGLLGLGFPIPWKLTLTIDY